MIERTHWTIDYVATLTPLQVQTLFSAMALNNNRESRGSSSRTKTGALPDKKISKNPKEIAQELLGLPGGVTKFVRRRKRKKR